MNRNKKKTKGIPKKLLALMLCCFCLVTAMPISAATPEPEATPAVETVVEQPPPSSESIPTAAATPTAEATPTTEPSATAEPSPSAESTPTAEPTPSAEATATAEPSAEPTTEPETASPSPSASPSATPAQSAANALNTAQARDAAFSVRIPQSGVGHISFDSRNSRDYSFSCTNAEGEPVYDGISAKVLSNDWGRETGYTIYASGSVPTGTYTLTVHYQEYSWFNWRDRTDEVTITITAAQNESAEVYYLLTPRSDPDSNDVNQWSADPIGEGTVNMAGATWVNDKNVFVSDNPSQYVNGMPAGMELQDDGSWLLRRTDYLDDYQKIFDAWHSQWESQFGGINLSVDDITIYLTPYKISRDNGTDIDKHIDCTISVQSDKIFTARFWVTKPGETQERLVDSGYYETGSSVAETEAAPTGDTTGEYPETIVGEDGITYEFVGWYNENDELVSKWPYTPDPEEIEDDGSVDFRAHYVPAEYNLTIQKTLSGNMYNANDKFDFTVTYADGTEQTITLGKDQTSKEISIPNGAKVTITETNAEGYEFSVASKNPADLDGYNVNVEGKSVSFTMPANNVSIVIDNKKDVDIDTGVFLDTLPYILILGVAAAGAVVLVKRRKHSDD